MKPLTRLGRLCCTTVTATTIATAIATRNWHSFSQTAATIFLCDVGAIALPMVIADRPWKRVGR